MDYSSGHSEMLQYVTFPCRDGIKLQTLQEEGRHPSSQVQVIY